MKFRFTTTRLEATNAVLGSMKAATKLTTNLIFRCSPTGIHIVADPSYRSNSPLMSRCELRAENLFYEYHFNGVSAEHNLIYFDVPCLALSNILATFHSCIKSLKIKLDNGPSGERQRFVLKFTVEYPSLDNSRYVHHDVGISIMKQKYWAPFEEQPVDPFNISMDLPNFRQLTPILERTSTLAQYAIVIGKRTPDNKATFSVGLLNDYMSAKTRFTRLTLHDDPNNPVNDNGVKIRIDIRRLTQVFNAMASIKSAQTRCSIRHNSAICFDFFNEFISFRITLPNYES